jgi:hypothetical protein
MKMIGNPFVKFKHKVSQSINYLESKNNPKPQTNQRPFVKQALRTKIHRLYPCDKNSKEKNLQNYKDNLSILEN